jgi:hypothetical protein
MQYYSTQLVRRAESESSNAACDMRSFIPSRQRVPDHLLATQLARNCLDCTTPDGKCMTLSWELAFRSSLIGKVDTNVSSHSEHTPDLFLDMPLPAVGTNNNCSRQCPSLVGCIPPISETSRSSQLEESVGDICGMCNERCITLYRRGTTLVCKQCQRR